jgi:hypothetical protein
MDMCSGNVDGDRYDAEVMCAGWNPEIAVMGKAIAQAATRLVEERLGRARERELQMPVDVAAMEGEAFLREMYAAQR